MRATRVPTQEAEDRVDEEAKRESDEAQRDGLEAFAGGAAGIGADDDEEGAIERDGVGAQSGKPVW